MENFKTIDTNFDAEHDVGKNTFLKSKVVSLTSKTIEVIPEDEELQKFKFFWLKFSIPGVTGTIKALGELDIPQKISSSTLKIKFKHLYPKDKMKIEKFIEDFSD